MNRPTDDKVWRDRSLQPQPRPVPDRSWIVLAAALVLAGGALLAAYLVSTA